MNRDEENKGKIIGIIIAVGIIIISYYTNQSDSPLKTGVFVGLIVNLILGNLVLVSNYLFRFSNLLNEVGVRLIYISGFEGLFLILLAIPEILKLFSSLFKV